MATLLEKAGEVARNSVGAALCNGLYLSSQLPAFGPIARRQRAIARGLYNNFCTDPTPPGLLPPPPPFQGGQCECISYRVNIELVDPPGLPFDQVRAGPISSPVNGVEVPENPGRKSWGYYYGAPACGGRQFELLASAGPDAPSDSFAVAINSVARVDGLPDDCGNPEPIVPNPPNPRPPDPPPVDEPVTPPGGGPDVIINFKPRIGPIVVRATGIVYIPVNIQVTGPSIDVDAEINVNVNLPDLDIDFNFGGGSGGDDDVVEPPSEVCCDPPPIEGDEDDGSDEDEPVIVEPGKPGLRLVGVRVLSSINADRVKATSVSQGQGVPTLWVPRLANVYFQTESQNQDGEPELSLTQDYTVKLQDQVIYAPANARVVGAFVSPSVGVTSAVRPIFIQDNSGR